MTTREQKIAALAECKYCGLQFRKIDARHLDCCKKYLGKIEAGRAHKIKAAKEWRKHPIFIGLEISDTGLIRSFRHAKKPKILKTRFDKLGYEYLGIVYNKKTFTRKVHRLVLEAFVSLKPKGLQCAHLDGNPSNNNLINLKWVTPQENTDHKKIHGTVLRGKDHPNSKLNEQKVLEIIKRCKSGERHTDIAKDYGVVFQVIYDIAAGNRWKHVHKKHEQFMKLLKGDG